MKFGLFPAVIAAAVIFLFWKGVYEEKRKEAALWKRLLDGYGKMPWGYEKKLGSSGHIDCSGTAVRAADGYLRYMSRTSDRFTVDTVTWKELDMEAVFARLDYTLSGPGREYLYALLHCPSEGTEEAQRWERAVQYFASHSRERVNVQRILAEIGRGKGLSCLDCLEAVGQREGQSLIREYAADMAYLPVFLLLFWDTAIGLAAFAAVIVCQIVTYFRERAKILPCLMGVAGLLRLVRGAERLHRCITGLEIAKETEGAPEEETEPEQTGREPDTGMEACIKRLGYLKRHSYWVLQCGREGSSPFSLFADYIRMLFHPDIIQFGRLQNKISELEPELWRAFQYVGFVDSCISIAMYRASLDQYCIPEMREAGFSAVDCVHPLLDDPVPNSIEIKDGKGVLLTGSNASGKSTFLKTVAVNLLFAQTIHTVLAESFSAPYCRIYTAMQDDGGSIRRGESSYMAEILSLKRIIDAESEDRPPVFCFVDEILRGTNTVERIAASTQILRRMRPPRIYCFAATHDRELTTLLERTYDNYHFTEEVEDGDIIFPYRLLAGSADTSNAIGLLAALGYEEEIVRRASEQAESFLQEGVWR